MKQIEKFMNAMAIDYAHAATGNRVKWAFTSDTRADVVEMAVAVYRRNARRPYMIIFPQYNAIRNVINTVAAVILEGDDTRNIMEGIENVNTFKVTGSPYDNDGANIYAPAEAPQEAPAAEAEQQPTETENAPQAATQAAEEPTTDEHKEEVNPMSNTNERYDYMEHMTADVIDAIRERYTDDEIRSRLDDDRDELAQELNDDLWTDDSVTGNASGSYYCNAWRAEEAIAHNWDLIADFIDEWDCADILRKGPEAIDVSIRCYLIGQAIDAALDELDDEIPEAKDDNTEDDEDDEDAADNISA